jgi:hypothetical protein
VKLDSAALIGFRIKRIVTNETGGCRHRAIDRFRSHRNSAGARAFRRCVAAAHEMSTPVLEQIALEATAMPPRSPSSAPTKRHRSQISGDMNTK